MIKIIKKIINFFISKTDWRIKKIYRNKSYTNTKPRIELLTAMSKAKGIIHMGAHRGTEAAIYNWLNKKTIWFEANPKIINDLRDNVLQFTNQKVIHSVLSDKDDEIIDFNISSNDGASSSLFLFGEANNIHQGIKMTHSIKLKTSTIDSIVNKNNINIIDYDFWVIDLQGAELKALKGAQNSLESCRYIHVEISKGDVYKNGVKWHELNEFLQRKGFESSWIPEEMHTEVLYVKNKT